MEYVADAHALLWYLYRPERLGKAALQVFADAEIGQGCIHIPAVIVAEALMVAEKGRLSGATLDKLVPHLRIMTGCTNYPLCSRQLSSPAMNILSSRIF